MEDRERRIRKRLRDDFPYYASRCLKIRTKKIQRELPTLLLNEAQCRIHAMAEEQLARTGRVRAMLLKSRQQGGSTYVQGRMLWKVSHNKGLRGYIVAHRDDSTQNLFKMAKIFYENLPDLVKPSRAASNAKELDFDQLNSGYKVATAGGRESGRSETIHFLHLSEAAYFPDAEALMAAILEAVPEAEGTEVWIESTSAGAQGRFWEMCIEAQRGEGDYMLVFVPWFWSTEYQRAVPPGFVRTPEEQEYAEWLKGEANWELSDEQLYWRRLKIVTLKGLSAFRREYPSTPEEAFKTEAPGALWKTETISRNRVAKIPEGVSLVRVVVAVDPSGGDKKKNDAQGIVVAGLGSDGHGYVLRDGTVKKSPAQWGKRVVDLYDEFTADRVVYEANFGGDMVKFVIQTARPDLVPKEVHASRGKAVRAEPISALYEDGMVHHVGTHYMLEDELVTWDPTQNMPSPNRLDALVWALTELMLGGGSGVRQRTLEV